MPGRIVTSTYRTKRPPRKRKAVAMSSPNFAALRALIHPPHIAPLTEYTRWLRRSGKGHVPYFDPQDGGIHARILFLFEKPGPTTERTGFICRDNNDPTAAAARAFWHQTGIPREATVLWNVMPWWDGTHKYTAADLQRGMAQLDRLISLLPELRVIVLVGRQAQKATPQLQASGLPILHSFHPSAKVRASSPEKWASIPRVWAKAYRIAKEKRQRT